ncbi:hypothetical protein ACQEUU_26680 [Nonomuraea sp. CA-218870]|uniref:hypothetical protein n=1 Tax=Nonomuraea sp. CA-218870 TaxID=3239998 RepID=UPI003D94912F
MRAPFAVLVAALLTACAGPPVCTAIGAPVGVLLDVEPPLAARVDRAELEVCWSGACHRPELILHPATAAVETICAGDTCSARMAETGGEHGFASVPGLPKSPVRARLKLRDADGRAVLDRTLDVTPEGRFPNGPECGEGGPNVQLVAGSGGVRAK